MNAERAAKIANDIAEDIDCGESRKELRECIRYWANKCGEKAERFSIRENTRVLRQLQKAMVAGGKLLIVFASLTLSGCADFDAAKFSQAVGTVGDAWERVDRQQHPERYIPADGPDTQRTVDADRMPSYGPK